jgi:hypothetical protein
MAQRCSTKIVSCHHVPIFRANDRRLSPLPRWIREWRSHSYNVSFWLASLP